MPFIGLLYKKSKKGAVYAETSKMKCIASLDEDGLIEILPGGGVRLPV